MNTTDICDGYVIDDKHVSFVTNTCQPCSDHREGSKEGAQEKGALIKEGRRESRDLLKARVIKAQLDHAQTRRHDAQEQLTAEV